MNILRWCFCFIPLMCMAPVATNFIHADNGFINLDECDDCGEIYSKDWDEPHECSAEESWS